jgi:hypothetical protein
MNGVVKDPIVLQALLHHKKRLQRTLQMVSLYKCRTLSELVIALQKDLDSVEAQIKEETK